MNENESALRFIRSCFGGTALELSGIVVAPSYQRVLRAGTHMMMEMIRAREPEVIYAHTRNPAILRLMAQFCRPLFPDVIDDLLQQYAQEYSSTAELIEDVAYHVNRYGEEGLYNGFDPADRQYGKTGMTLKERFPGLENVGTALVVVGKVTREIRS